VIKNKGAEQFDQNIQYHLLNAGKLIVKFSCLLNSAIRKVIAEHVEDLSLILKTSAYQPDMLSFPRGFMPAMHDTATDAS